MANKQEAKSGAAVFSVEKWLETANADKAKDILTQREIDDAREIWVNALDGKTKDEIAASGQTSLRDEWFIEV